MSMFYDPGKIEDRKYWLNTFLDENDSRREDIGLILVGRNGDSSHDQLYPELESVFSPLGKLFYLQKFLRRISDINFLRYVDGNRNHSHRHIAIVQSTF